MGVEFDIGLGGDCDVHKFAQGSVSGRGGWSCWCGKGAVVKEVLVGVEVVVEWRWSAVKRGGQYTHFSR